MFSELIRLTCILCAILCITSGSINTDDIDVETVREMVERIVQLEKKVEQLTSDRTEVKSDEGLPRETYAPIGATYIRWGRKRCDGDATLVYPGHAAGGHYAQAGGGANFLCLHEVPQKNVYFPGFTAPGYGMIHGIQYVVPENNYVFSKNNSGGLSLSGFPAPCAACYVTNRTAVLMIPARIDCPFGWTKEYQGYVVSEATNYGTYHYRSQYTCWDEAPEAAEGGYDEVQAFMYVVEIGCGTLPCSPYIGGTELTCVVCTK